MPAKTTQPSEDLNNPYGYSDMDWAAQLDPAYALLPADTRVPDHTIWHHADTATALLPADTGSGARQHKGAAGAATARLQVAGLAQGTDRLAQGDPADLEPVGEVALGG